MLDRLSDPLIAGPAHHDAAVQALYQRFRTSVVAMEAAESKALKLYGAVARPPLSSAAAVRHDDKHLGIPAPLEGNRYKREPWLAKTAHLDGFYRPGEAGYAVVKRVKEILDALDVDDAALRAAEHACGYDAADREELEAIDVVRADLAALAAARATTLEGAMLKARAIRTFEGDLTEVEEWAAAERENGCLGSTSLAISLVVDLLSIPGLLPAAEVQA